WQPRPRSGLPGPAHVGLPLVTRSARHRRLLDQTCAGDKEERMFKTIVVAHDGSEGAKRALPFAVELAKRDGARIVIAHVEEDIVGKGGGPIHATEDEIQADIRRQAEE